MNACTGAAIAAEYASLTRVSTPISRSASRFQCTPAYRKAGHANGQCFSIGQADRLSGVNA